MDYAKDENGIVKNYGNLEPLGNYKHWLNFWKESESVHNSENFFKVVKPPITVYQRYIKLIPSDLSGTQFTHRIYNFNAQEIEDYDQEQEDNDNSANKYTTRVSDGQVQYKRFVNKIIRDKDNSVITGQQALNVILNFNEGMQFLKDGFQEAAKSIINGITPADQYETGLQTLIIDKLTEYIQTNPL